jgi:hypothetical protein
VATVGVLNCAALFTSIVRPAWPSRQNAACAPRCHLGLFTDAREQEHLATAMTMYHEMGMTYWLEKAEAEIQSASPDRP